MNKLAMLLLLLVSFSTLISAQPFQREANTIPVEINEWYPFSPWTAGHQLSDPELIDIDGDGDHDFFVGHGYWYPAYYENVGTSTEPCFAWITEHYDSLKSPGIYWNTSPKFCDIDDDGDFDVFISCLANLSSYYENIGSISQPNFILREDTLKDIGGTPVYGMIVDLVDIDSDGDYDFFGGRGTGAISFYRNIGNQDSFLFQMEEPQFENIDVGSGARPCFVDIDADFDFDILIGNDEGQIWYFQNTGDSLAWDFQFITSQFDSIDVFISASPAICDIDADDDFDLFSGCDADVYAPRGDIYHWENQGSPQLADYTYITSEYLCLDDGYTSNAEFCDIDADQDFDMFIKSGTNMSFFENIGTPEIPSFTLITEDYQDLEPGHPKMYDLDSDGDFDFISGEGFFTYAEIRIYENIGTPEQASFSYWFSVTQPDALFAIVEVADINADGDGDLFFGDGWGDFYYFENIGSPSRPSFDFVTQNFQGIDYPSGIYPEFIDWDGDGDLDLFLGGIGPDLNRIGYYENIGSPQNPQLQLITPDFFGEYLGENVSILDIDLDGDYDFFLSFLAGGVNFVRNLAASAVPPRALSPYRGPVLTLGPNPANPSTWISFTLTAPQEATLAVYNILGAKVTTLTTGPQKPGEHTYYWNASQNASGVYIIRLETPQYTSAQRVMVVK